VALENQLVRRTDLLVTVGEQLRRHFADRGAPRSVVVGNWKQLHEFAKTPEERLAVRARAGIPAEALTLVCITQLLKDRKIEPLLDAVDATPNVYLIVGGKGILEELVVRRARQNPRIVYVGFVKNHDIPAYTCAADVVYYGFDPNNPNARFSAPNKLFEALASGRPLITGDFGEIADVVRETNCGVILAHYDRDTICDALRTLSDKATRHEMEQRALAYGRTTANWEKAEQTLRREYSRLLGTTAPAIEENAALRQTAG
jgi:glycosyltransferase involved in cell wall biosynthesis